MNVPNPDCFPSNQRLKNAEFMLDFSHWPLQHKSYPAGLRLSCLSSPHWHSTPGRRASAQTIARSSSYERAPFSTCNPRIKAELKNKGEEENKKRESRREHSLSSGRCSTSPGKRHPKPDWRPRHCWPSAADQHPCARGRSRQTYPLPARWHPGILSPPKASHPTPGSLLWRSSWGDTPPKKARILK